MQKTVISYNLDNFYHFYGEEKRHQPGQAAPGQPLAEIVTTIKNYIWSPHSFPQVVRLYRNEVNILDNHVRTTEMHEQQQQHHNA